MQFANWSQQSSDLNGDDLRRMIGPDELRPGPAYARLRAELIPVWAIVGHHKALASQKEPLTIADEMTFQVASLLRSLGQDADSAKEPGRLGLCDAQSSSLLPRAARHWSLTTARIS